MSYVGLPNQVPAKVIAPFIERWEDEYRAEHPRPSTGPDHDSYIETRAKEGSLEILSFRSGVSGRVLRRIKTGTVQSHGNSTTDHISFETADKIITAINPHLWREDETLKPFYGPLEVRAYELKEGYELPEGFDWDGLPRSYQYLWLNARQRLGVAA